MKVRGSDARMDSIFGRVMQATQRLTEARECRYGDAACLPVVIPDDLRSWITVSSAVKVRCTAERHVHVVRPCCQLRLTCNVVQHQHQLQQLTSIIK